MRKLLIANRGEIAVRIIRACRDLGLSPIAVHSDCDGAARHVRMADEAVAIGGAAPGDSYLRIDRLLDAARVTGADAVHPGYGFLAEHAGFASACVEAGLIFVGPPPDAIARMGSKDAARGVARDAGVPVVPGSDPMPAAAAEADLLRHAETVGYPLVVKAVAGGGGKGMRLVAGEGELVGAVRAARSEAAAAFGEPAIYFERHLTGARHIEVQLLADAHGTVVPFVERECSVQRRYQKLVEESPSPAVTPSLRDALLEAAAALATAVGYRNAGTVEFLLDPDGRFYFLEMNTRLQVEHPVTEMVTGIDLVCWQLRIARGEPLTLDPAGVRAARGHAIECRISAEDPDAGFLPSPGRITGLRTPAGPGIREDSGVDAYADVPGFYDPLLAKLIGWGETRGQAMARLRRALDEYEIMGIRTSVPFFRWLLRQETFREGTVHTGWLEAVLLNRRGEPFSPVEPAFEEVALAAAAIRLTADAVAPPVNGSAATAAAAPRIGGGWALRARLDALRP